MSDNTNSSNSTYPYPKWPGILAIVAVSVTGALVFFLAGFAAGRCSGHPMRPPVHMSMMSNGGGGGERQQGDGPGGRHRAWLDGMGPGMKPQGMPFGAPRGEGPGALNRGADKDKKIDGATTEATPATPVKK